MSISCALEKILLESKTLKSSTDYDAGYKEAIVYGTNIVIKLMNCKCVDACFNELIEWCNDTTKIPTTKWEVGYRDARSAFCKKLNGIFE